MDYLKLISLSLLSGCFPAMDQNELNSNGEVSDLSSISTAITGSIGVCPVETDTCEPVSVCSGSLIDDPLIAPEPVFLTAAHCVEEGPFNRSEGFDTVIIFPAQSALLVPYMAIHHPDYKSGDIYNLDKDLATVILAPWSLKKARSLKAGSIERIRPPVKLDKNLEYRFRSGNFNSEKGLVRTIQSFDLKALDQNPSLFTIGYGIDGMSLVMGKKILYGVEEDRCHLDVFGDVNFYEQHNIDGNVYHASWSGYCTASFYTSSKFDNRISEFIPRTTEGKLVGYIDSANNSFGNGTGVIVSPTSATPDQSPCSGDSGGPAFLDKASSKVFALLSAADVGNFPSGKPLCRGDINSYVHIAPLIPDVKGDVARALDTRATEVVDIE